MAKIMKIIENYSSLPNSKKVEAILDDYAIFDRIIAGIENDLIIDICDERALNRRTQRGNTGVRVQTSVISDIPFSIVAEKDEVERAVKTGDYFTALKGIKESAVYVRRMNNLYQLQDDYKIVTARVGFLQPEEYQIYTRYLNRVKPVLDLVEEVGISYEAYTSRIYRYRLAVKKYSLEAMNKRACKDMAA